MNGSKSSRSMGKRQAAKVVELASYRSRRRRRSTLKSHWLTLTLLAILTSCFGSWYVLTRTDYLQIKQVAVSGNERVPTEQILSAAGIALGDRPWQHLPWQVRSRILQVDPWIEDAAVRIRWPLDRMEIVIRERTPTHLISLEPEDGGPNQFVWIDRSGVVVDIVQAPTPEALPLISGLTAAEIYRGMRIDNPALDDALYLLSRMSPELRDEISEIHVTPDRQVTLFLRTPLTVKWGLVPEANRDAETAAKLADLGGLLNETLNAEKTICLIDMRDAKQAVLRECPPN